MNDWTDFFLQRAPRRAATQTRVAHARVALSIFDSPDSVEPKSEEKPEPKPEPPKAEKPAPEPPKAEKPAPEPPKAEPPASVFDAPSPDAAKPKEKPAKPKAEKPSGSKWLEFLGIFYEQGKKTVKNPNPKTAKKYPEVMFTTAMKFKPFSAQVAKEFQAWLQQGGEKPASKPTTPEPEDDSYTNEQYDDELGSIIDEWESTDGDFKELESIGMKFWGDKWNPDMHGEMLTTVKEHFEYALEDAQSQGDGTGFYEEQIEEVQKKIDGLKSKSEAEVKKPEPKKDKPKKLPKKPIKKVQGWGLAPGMTVKQDGKPKTVKSVSFKDGLQIEFDDGSKWSPGFDDKIEVFAEDEATPLEHGDKVTSGSQLTPDLILRRGSQTVQVVKRMPDGRVRIRLFKKDGTWAKGTKYWPATWAHISMPAQEWEVIGDPTKEAEPPKEKLKVGDKVPDAFHLSPGDIVSVKTYGTDYAYKIEKVMADGSLRIYRHGSGDTWYGPHKWSAHQAKKLFNSDDSKIIEHPDIQAKKDKEEAEAKAKIQAEEYAKAKAKKEKEKAEKAKKIEANRPKPKKGKHVTALDSVKLGDAITWEHEGKTYVGRVSDQEGKNFYVATVDPKTGVQDGLFALGEYDLLRLPVAQISESDLPPSAKAKLAPKPTKPVPPEAPKLPKAPEPPKSKKITEPSEVKVGDYVEWELKDKTYRGKVVSFDEDGKFRAKIDWPEGTGSLGKTPSFDAKKIVDRGTRVIDPGAMAKYDEVKTKHDKEVSDLQGAHQKAVAKQDAKFQEAMSAWQTQKDQIEGKSWVPKRPVKREQGENIPSAPEAWDHDHPIMEQAFDLVDEYSTKYASFFAEKRKELEKKAQSSTVGGSSTAAKQMWDERSMGEKMLAIGAHDFGHKFMEDVLTPTERQKFYDYIGNWQGSSGSAGGHKLMGALEAMGVEGKMKAHDKGKEPYRAEGAQDKVLQTAIAKAMAYTQAVGDALGVEEITLYRGGKSSTSSLSSAKAGQMVALPNARELTSFSASPSTAYGFGMYQMRSRVPISRLFLSPITYPKLGAGSGSGSGYGENEFIVAGIAGDGVQRMPPSMSDYDPVVMNAPSKKAASMKTAADEDEDWDDDHEDWSKHMEDTRTNKKTAVRILRLAKNNDKFRDELLGAMRRVNAPRDFAVEQEAQQVLLAHLQAGDVVRFAFRTSENAPAEEETRVALFDYDPANRGVELSTEGSGRAMLEDRGQNEGVVYIPSSGPARPLLKITHVRSRI